MTRLPLINTLGIVAALAMVSSPMAAEEVPRTYVPPPSGPHPILGAGVYSYEPTQRQLSTLDEQALEAAREKRERKGLKRLADEARRERGMRSNARPAGETRSQLGGSWPFARPRKRPARRFV